MLAGIAVAAVVMALVTGRQRRLAAQERAIAAVEKLGGLIGARPFMCVIDSARRPVLAICLNDPDVCDADVAALASLTELETLDLSGVR